MDDDDRDAKESEVANRTGFAYLASIREKTEMPVISFAFNRAGLTGAFRHGWLSLSDPKTDELAL
jgi:hypothetical protein